MHEWPLLIFTLLVQASIGGMFALSIYLQLVNKDEQTTFQLAKLPLIVISIVSLIGLAASFSHLGSPLNAFYTITNIGSSWFSREIIFVGFFIFLTLSTTALLLVKKKVNMMMMYVTSFVGLCAVFMMASIYVSSLITEWDGIGTYAAFYATTLLVGATLVACLCKQQMDKSLMGLFLIAAVGLMIKLIFLPGQLATIAEFNIAQQPFLYSQLILSIVSLFLLGYVTFIRKSAHPLLWAAFLIAFIGEFLARYMFFMNAI